MDQIKTGKFISALRKEKGFTQVQLADRIGISDKTVSKWECGSGLPEVSLMLPLCEILGISVNELLAGKRLADSEYRSKAEDTIMDLMTENRENKKRMLQSAVCGCITIVAACALIVIASYLDMPVPARIGLIAFAVVIAVAGIGTAVTLDINAGYFECPECGHLFVPPMREYVKAYHTFTKRKLTCPACGRTGLCRHRITR